MIKVGLTGGIGSGKSHVAGLLRGWHIPVYDTDKEAKRLMTESQSIRREVTACVGVRAYMPDGTLNREAVASYLFVSSLHTERINRIVHPAVRDDFLNWADRQSAPLVVMECAILFETGFDSLVDEVLLVRAPEKVRMERIMRRDGISEAQVRARMAVQMSDEERCRRVRYVIDNDVAADISGVLRDILMKISKGGQHED